MAVEFSDTIIRASERKREMLQPSETGKTNEAAGDAELFKRFQDGDNTAFLELFDRHAQRIGQYCHRIIGEREQAQDMVQDVWETVMKYRDREEVTLQNPLALFYRIARNRCLNYLRDRRLHTPLNALKEEQHPLIENRSMSQLEELVLIALERLPLAEREVLVLHIYSEYKFEEIAEMMSESSGAIRTRAWRARRQLKRVIAALIELDDNYKNK